MGFRDEFRRLDPTLWAKSDYPTPHWRLRPEHVEVKDDVLHCRVPAGKNEGGQIETIRRYTFGRYRCRMKASNVANVVTAFYTYRHDAGLADEVDLEIYGDTPTLMDLVVWNRGEHDLRRIDLGFDSSKAFHTYGFDWYKDHIDVFVDEKLVLTYSDTRFIPVRDQYCLLCSYSPAWKGVPPEDSESLFDWVIVEAEAVPPFPWWLVITGAVVGGVTGYALNPKEPLVPVLVGAGLGAGGGYALGWMLTRYGVVMYSPITISGR